jgi:hypothetical protein
MVEVARGSAFGSPAALSLKELGPVALRPTLSGGLPLSTHRYSVVLHIRIGRQGGNLNLQVGLICSDTDAVR